MFSTLILTASGAALVLAALIWLYARSYPKVQRSYFHLAAMFSAMGGVGLLATNALVAVSGVT